MTINVNQIPSNQAKVDSASDFADVSLTTHTTVLLGKQNGKYPDANSILIRGSQQTALIDLTLGIKARQNLPPINLVLLSHCHEDHFVGIGNFGAAEVWVHQAEQHGLRSLDDLLDSFGVTGKWREETARGCIETFDYSPRPDARSFVDGQTWDLGGVSIRAIHAPGHTAGHCLFHIMPDDVLFLADIDLSSFGPFYADVGSSIDDFEQSIELASRIKAAYYVTAHHKGIVDPASFDQLIESYAAVIPRREKRLLEFLDQPKTLDEVVDHRFIYRPGDPVPGGDFIERVSMQMHLDRMLACGAISQTDGGTYQRCDS